MRIGNGFDVHKFDKSRKLILGGIEIDYEYGLLGHSDADVLVHAIMDALLGACGYRDIGCMFPDTDNQYKGICSLRLLEQVNNKLIELGYGIVNIDATIIAQKPKLADYIDSMEKTISQTLNISTDKINIKATTTENLGFCGRGEGIAAMAVCLID